MDYGRQQRRLLGRRQPESGEWLLDSVQYLTWLSAEKQSLCPRIPGAGKTFMTAIVVNKLHSRFQMDDSVGIAYIYCNYRQWGEQTPTYFSQVC